MKMKLSCGAFFCILLMSSCRAAPIIPRSLSSSVDHAVNDYPEYTDSIVGDNDVTTESLDDEPFTFGSALDYNPSTLSRMYEKVAKLRAAETRPFAENLAERIAEIFRRMIVLLMNPDQSEFDVLNLLESYNTRRVSNAVGAANASATPSEIVKNFFHQVHKIINSPDPDGFDTHLREKTSKSVNDRKRDATASIEYVSDSQEDVSDPQEDVSDPQEDVSDPQEDVSDPQENASDPQDDVSDPQEDSADSQEDSTVPDKTHVDQLKTLAVVLKKVNNLLEDISGKVKGSTDQAKNVNDSKGLNHLTNDQVNVSPWRRNSSGVVEKSGKVTLKTATASSTIS